jgi:hypothetical protein
MRKKGILGAVAAIMAFGLFGAPAASATVVNDGSDPIGTGCVQGAYVVSSWPMVNQKYNQVQGQMQLVYSPVCQTNWINVYGNVSGNEYAGSIFVGTVPQSGQHAVVYNIGSDYSNQVNAPGSTCVTVGSNIFDIATGAVEGNDSRVFC